MNRFVLFYSKMVLLLLSLEIVACSNSDKVEMDDYLTVGTDSVRFSADGGVFEMKVTASQDWTVSMSEEADEWCYSRKKVGSYLAIWTGKNTQEKEKIQEIVLTSGNKMQKVRVYQQSGSPEEEGKEEDDEIDDDPIEDVTKIFADDIYTQLRPEVNDEMILRISTPWLRSLAYDLWSNKYPLEDRVRLYEAFDEPGVVSSKLKTAKYSRHDNPTGIAVEKGEELMVCVEDDFGQYIILEVSNWEVGFSGSKTYTLRKGINKLLMKDKGLCYLRYISRDYASLQPIKIHIIGGKVNGIFCTYATSTCTANTLDEWPAKLDQAEKASGFLDVVGRYTHWIAETQAFTRANTQPFLLMGAYDRLQRYEMELMGLFKYDRVPKNRMLFHAGPYNNPHASDYRTGYPKAKISYLRASADTILTESAWGAAHEAGHVNQTRPGLKWIGMTEVTNNLHSLLVSAKFNGGSSKLNERCDYNGAVQDFYIKQENHNTGEYFNKLAPFWQLYLYTVEVLEGNSTQGQPYKDFYLDLHEQIRTTFTPSGVGPQVLNFAKKTCDVLELDITDYLQDIGFLREIDRTVADYSSAHMKITTEDIAEVKSYASKYPKGSSGIIYLTSQNFTRFRDLLKNDVKPSPAKVIVTGTTVSFSQWTNAVGFEVWKNGRAIAASPIPRDSYIPQSVISVPGVLNLDGCTFYGVAADGTRVAASGIQ